MAINKGNNRLTFDQLNKLSDGSSFWSAVYAWIVDAELKGSYPESSEAVDNTVQDSKQHEGEIDAVARERLDTLELRTKKDKNFADKEFSTQHQPALF